jgi:FAD/FMN-containing dehydrogenase
MPDIMLSDLEGQKKSVDEKTLQVLQAKLQSPLLRPGDAGFDEAATIWNGMITKRPGLIAQPQEKDEVVACVDFARTNGILLSVKGGGHNIAGTAIADGGLMVDMSHMKMVTVDTEAKTAKVEGGCLLGDVDKATQAHGLSTVLGFVSLTGAAGLTLGGGFGYLTRRFGYAVDNLLEVELVTADGQLRKASASENEDLFWAVRGGGGNYGVVTSFVYRLHEVGPKIMGGLMFWDASEKDAFLAFFKEYTANAPRELATCLLLRLAPPAPFIPKEYHGKPVVGILLAHTGTLEQAKTDLAPLKGFGKPIADTVMEKTYVEMQSMLDPMQPRGMHYYVKAEYTPAVTDGLLEAMWKSVEKLTSPKSQITLFHIGGAIAEHEPEDGAVGNRNAEFVCMITGMWAPNEPGSEAYPQWVTETWERIKPFSTGGSYINFQSADEQKDRVQQSYGKNYPKLTEVKRKYDPQNLFRTNRNIDPQG